MPAVEFEKTLPTLGSGKISESILREKALNISESYIRVVKPQYLDNSIEQGTDLFYTTSLNKYTQLIEKHILKLQDYAFYYYKQQHHSGVELSGWIVGVDAYNYVEGSVKKHENTLIGKENRLIEHIRVLESMGEPVLLTQKLPLELKTIAKEILKNPISEINDEYNNVHQLWQVTDIETIHKVIAIFNQFDSLYIADGHHRVASASRFLIENKPLESEKGFMALVMDENDLLIKSFYRLLKDIDESKLLPFLTESGINFEFIENMNRVELIQGKVICLSNDFLILIDLGQPLVSLNAQEKLDVSRIEDLIFKSLYNINETSNDSRILFSRGDNPVNNVLEQLKNKEISLAFQFAPNTMQEIKDVADAGLIMPPKSTFIEPKLLTGMLIEDYRSI